MTNLKSTYNSRAERKRVCLNLGDCNGLGDLICATSTIRKLAHAYGQKIIVVSQMPELFKKNPDVAGSYKTSSINWNYFNDNFIMHNSFYGVGSKNERGVEMHHNAMDIRQFHAIHLGFMLKPSEMGCYYEPNEEFNIELPEHFVCIHPVSTWENRTWPAKNWMMLTKNLNDLGYSVVSVGKDSHETGFFNIDKPIFNFPIDNGLNLMNKTNISDTWHILNRAACVVTMDSGILHLAGTTKRTHIIQLGSAIEPSFRAPYRNGEQDYRYDYVLGKCNLHCCSNLKYALDYWDDINSIPPLIKCLENKKTYECHPSVEKVLKTVLNAIE